MTRDVPSGLVLSRHIQEGVSIIDNQTGEIVLRVFVVETRGDWARLLFSGDKSRYNIVREEILPESCFNGVR